MWNSMVFGSAGTVVEWSDYGLYLYLVPVMAPLFFPSDDPLIATIAGFGVRNAIFCGTAPLVCSALISATGQELAPSYYLVVASLLVVWPMVRLRETARLDVRALEAQMATR
jgi:MHS family proline/betaine transporter-like MFS transporter